MCKSKLFSLPKEFLFLTIIILVSIANLSLASQYWNPDLHGQDNFVNFGDFAVFAENWQRQSIGLSGDFDDNGTVEVNDLAYFSYYWLKSTTFEYVPCQILVAFNAYVNQTTIEVLANSLNCSIIRKLRKRNVYLWKIQGMNRENEVILQLQANPIVLYAERNGLAYQDGQIIPNDPNFNLQWNLYQINAPEGWYEINNKYGRIGVPNVVIAIVDTGVDYDHPDLLLSMWSDANGYHGYDFINDDNFPMDDVGHGTHVAGIAAAVTNNSIGVAGVGWGCSIMAVKVLSSFGGGSYADIIDGIDYAVDKEANVINLSLGGTANSIAFENAINDAYNEHVVIVAAAGNESDNLDVNSHYPACYNNVVCVSATDSNDQPAYFTNYGSYVDVSAPGVDIYSNLWNDTYDYMSGTSMACPHVSGLAALCISMCSCLDPNNVKESITRSAVDLGTPGKDDYYGYGRINVYETVRPPHFITNINELQNVNNHLNWYYILCQDIDASDTFNWNGGAGFLPISSIINSEFRGCFDGKGHTIANLWIYRPIVHNVGLFSRLNSCTIRNLNLESVNISGWDEIGALVGLCNASEISNCSSSGIINGEGYVGGLIGYNIYSNINYCHSSCTINGSVVCGGLIGKVFCSNISHSYALGDVYGSGYWQIGGLIGNLECGTINDCFAMGNVHGNYFIGGLIGSTIVELAPQDVVTVINCYSTGTVSPIEYAGGLIGPVGIYESAPRIIINSFWDITTSGIDYSYGGIGKTDTEMKQKSTFSGWDFNNIWDINEGVTYPFLRE